MTRLVNLAENGLVQYQVHSARLSPDATRMAYGNAVVKPVGDGLFGSFPPDSIFVRDAATSVPGVKVASLEGSEVREFFWSPDSRQIALTSWSADTGNRNWVVDVASQKLHEVHLPKYHTPDGKEHAMTIAAWSPDGGTFAAGDEELLYLVPMNKSGQVWNWSGRKRLTREPHRILGGTCSFSPDGRKVLFVTVDDQTIGMSLMTAEIDGGQERVLIASGAFTDLYGCWSPEGNRVAFSGSHLDATGKRVGLSGIYILNDAAETLPVLEEVHPPEQFRLRLVDWR